MIPQEMLQSLVKQVAALHPVTVLQKTTQAIDEIIWESDLDGTFYYLVRHRPHNNHQSSVNLSPREQAIAKLVAEGLPNKSIAKQLGIAHWTVATHLRRIFVKLNVHSRAAMIAKLSDTDFLP